MPGTRTVRDCGRRARNGASGRLSCRQRASSRSRPRFHDVISAVSATPSTSGTQPPSGTFSRLEVKNRKSIRKKKPNTDDGGGARPVELAAEHHRRQHAGAEEGAGDGDAIGRGQIVGGLERQHQDGHADHHHGVHLRKVDLAFLHGAGVAHRQARQKAQLHALPRHRKGAGDHRLAGDHRRRGGQDHHGQARSSCGPSRKNGFDHGVRLGDQSARPGRNSSAPGRAARRTARQRGSASRPKCPMSAYSASAPVTHSTTEPSTTKASNPWCRQSVAA